MLLISWLPEIRCKSPLVAKGVVGLNLPSLELSDVQSADNLSVRINSDCGLILAGGSMAVLADEHAVVGPSE